MHQAAGQQRIDVQVGGRRIGVAQAVVGQRVAEEGQAFGAQRVQVVGEFGEDLGQPVFVALAGRLLAGAGQQCVVALAALAGQRDAALLDFAEARGMGAGGVRAQEADRFLQRLEAGLAQQDGVLATRRAFDHFLGWDAAARHGGLQRVDVQRARGQVVDVRAGETDHVGDRAMGVVQGLVGLGRDGGLAVPAEGLAHLFDEFVRLGAVQAAVPFELLGQRQRARREDVAPFQDLARLRGQGLVFEQFQAQQRGEHTEGIGRQRRVAHGAEGGGMDRDAGDRRVVVADGLHAHDREHAPHGRQFGGRAQADGAVALRFSRSRLAERARLSRSSGDPASTSALMSATRSSRVPYCGTSWRYMSDMAREKRVRMSSGETREERVMAGNGVRVGKSRPGMVMSFIKYMKNSRLRDSPGVCFRGQPTFVSEVIHK